MAALNLATRVSQQLDSDIGDVVGYQINLQAVGNNETNITYYTYGVFLQKLVHQQNLINKLDLIILDEVHERDIESDLSLVILKHMLAN